MAGGPFAAVPAALPPRVFAAVRAVVFALALAPLAELVRLGLTGGLGANPVEFVLRWLGTWTLVALLATLSITPLRWMTGWAWLLRLRRMLGLYAFFYGTLHVTSYVWIDHFFDWTQIVDDIAKRPYLTFGFLAYVLMVPLAVTSTNSMVRRMGGRNWQRLHRLAYVSAAGGVVHYYWLVKADTSRPVRYALLLALLLAVRVWYGRTAAASASRRGPGPAELAR